MNHLVYYIYLIPLFISALVSIRAYRNNWPGPYRKFSIFLLVVLVAEIISIVWKYWLYKQFSPPYTQNNIWIYNPVIIGEYLFYLYFYHNASGKKILPGNTIWYFMGGYAVLGIINMLFVQGIFTYPTYTLFGSSLIVLFLTVNYFISMLKANKVIQLSTSPLTWISIGSFIYHLCSVPYFLFFSYVLRTNVNLAISLIIIMTIFNFFMYSLYTIAFLCRKHFQQ
jgi:hypothetical protein